MTAYRKPTENEEKFIDHLVDWWHEGHFSGWELTEVLYLTEEDFNIWVRDNLIPEDWHLR